MGLLSRSMNLMKQDDIPFRCFNGCSEMVTRATREEHDAECPRLRVRSLEGRLHTDRAPWRLRSRAQTELCATFSRAGTCPYGHKCQFAHGVEELRVRQVNAPAICTSWPGYPSCRARE